MSQYTCIPFHFTPYVYEANPICGDSPYAGADSRGYPRDDSTTACSRVHAVVHFCGARELFEPMPNSPYYVLGMISHLPCVRQGPSMINGLHRRSNRSVMNSDSASRQIFLKWEIFVSLVSPL